MVANRGNERRAQLEGHALCFQIVQQDDKVAQ
jgi:hypothetical protein